LTDVLILSFMDGVNKENKSLSLSRWERVGERA
jgi:hypothetical protein